MTGYRRRIRLFDVTRPLVEQHGAAWVTAAVSQGQFSHPDGLYFGGGRTEESNQILARVVGDRLAGTDDVLVVDLHTGHGEFGTYTLLSHVPQGHPDDTWLRSVFDADRIECTSSASATTGPKHGQIAAGPQRRRRRHDVAHRHHGTRHDLAPPA